MSEEQAYDFYMRGQEMLSSRNPDQAAVLLKRASQLEPDHSSIREALGRAYFAAGRFEQAAAEFQTVLELYPTNHYAHYCLGRCAEKLGDERLSQRHFSLARAMGYSW